MERTFDRYVVIKWSDARKCLTNEEQKELVRLGRKFQQHRRDTDRPWEVVVVEHDWPEYEPVWNMIEHRVDNPENNILIQGTEHILEYGECFLHVNSNGEVKIIDPSKVTIHGVINHDQ